MTVWDDTFGSRDADASYDSFAKLGLMNGDISCGVINFRGDEVVSAIRRNDRGIDVPGIIPSGTEDITDPATIASITDIHYNDTLNLSLDSTHGRYNLYSGEVGGYNWTAALYQQRLLRVLQLCNTIHPSTTHQLRGQMIWWLDDQGL
mmetsp:Transcript_19725/g.58218  ORF Transcript_19725/g.58218 Transcript_19725/m.58218 type:complete len:148 (+) Transcript_19725:70-513(+)